MNHEETRRNTKAGPRETGTVKWFSDEKGYGFITRAGKPDVFVHYSEISGQRGRRRLCEGQQVEFGIEETGKGLAARDVRAVK